MTLIVETDPRFASTLAFALGSSQHTDSLPGAVRYLAAHPDEVLVVVGPDLDLGQALELAATWQLQRPHTGMVLLRRRLDVEVLGRALRAGVREVTTPDDLGEVVAAARRSGEVSRRLREMVLAGDRGTGPSRQARVLTVFSAKGGSGKTTVATNLAATLANGGTAQVCLLDLDLEFGDIAIAMQLVPHRTVVDLVPMLGSMDERGVASALTPVGPGLDALLAPVAPADAAKVSPALVTELLRVLRHMYDYVVIDTPPTISEQVLATFDASESLILLATLDVPALKNLKVTLDTLDLLGYPKESRLVVLNRADSRVGLELADVERTLGTAVTVQIPSSGDVPATINRGRLIVRELPAHPVSFAVHDLANHVLGIGHEPAAVPRSGGLLARLRRGGTA